MKTVLLCDFCSHTEDYRDDVKMVEHEKTCSFNPLTKHCYTCKHEYEAGYPISGHMAGCRCRINLNTCDGEDDGNCKGHEAKDRY